MSSSREKVATEVNRWLSQLSTNQSISLDKRGHCALKINQGTTVGLQLNQPGDALVLLSYIGDQCTERDEIYLLKQLLQWNFKSDSLANCMLGLCGDQGGDKTKSGDETRIVLKAFLAVERLDHHILRNKLSHFSSTVEQAHKKIKASKQESHLLESSNSKDDFMLSQHLNHQIIMP